MTATAHHHELDRESRVRRGPGLVRAEILKLRKRRGLVLSTLALTVVPMLIGFTVTTIMHASDPSQHETAGGLENFTGAFGLFAMLVGVAAVLVGATVGSADVGAGVFRELVVTGRSRWQLFAARVPGGLAFLLPPVLAGFAVAAVAATALAGSAEAPSGELILEAGAWVTLAATASFTVALGLSSLIGSRAAIGLLLAWQLAVAPLLLAIEMLGALRQALLPAAMQNLAPAALEGEAAVAMSTTAAVVVVAVWVGVSLAIGAAKTATRDA